MLIPYRLSSIPIPGPNKNSRPSAGWVIVKIKPYLASARPAKLRGTVGMRLSILAVKLAQMFYFVKCLILPSWFGFFPKFGLFGREVS
jgi:hypothetical protein